MAAFDFGTHYTFRAIQWVHTLRSQTEKYPASRHMVVHLKTAEGSRRSMSLPEGGTLDDMSVVFSISPGERPNDGKLPEHSLGLMGYSPGTRGPDYYTERSAQGWFFLPDSIFDEAWRLSSQTEPVPCHLSFEFEALEMMGDTYVWRNDKRPLPVRNVSLSFFREVNDPKSAEQSEQRKPGLFERLTR